LLGELAIDNQTFILGQQGRVVLSRHIVLAGRHVGALLGNTSADYLDPLPGLLQTRVRGRGGFQQQIEFDQRRSQLLLQRVDHAKPAFEIGLGIDDLRADAEHDKLFTGAFEPFQRLAQIRFGIADGIGTGLSVQIVDQGLASIDDFPRNILGQLRVE